MEPWIKELFSAGGFALGIGLVIVALNGILKLLDPYIRARLEKGGTTVPGAERKRCIPKDCDIRVIATMVAETNTAVAELLEGVRAMADQLGDLHEWHSQTDEDGVRVWYVRQSFYRMMERIGETNQRVAQLLDRLVSETQETHRAISRVEAKQNTAPPA